MAMKKVKTVLDPKFEKMSTDKMRSIVEVELQDGRVLSRVADTARGTPEKPLKRAELYNKFRECASFVLEEKEIERIFETIERVGTTSKLKRLTKKLGR
jgi:2-methylcitrate dehydratase PrpD